MCYLPFSFVLVISSVPQTCELFVLFNITLAQFRDGGKEKTLFEMFLQAT